MECDPVVGRSPSQKGKFKVTFYHYLKFRRNCRKQQNKWQLPRFQAKPAAVTLIKRFRLSSLLLQYYSIVITIYIYIYICTQFIITYRSFVCFSVFMISFPIFSHAINIMPDFQWIMVSICELHKFQWVTRTYPSEMWRVYCTL